jgi:hypothetical protein
MRVRIGELKYCLNAREYCTDSEGGYECTTNGFRWFEMA